MLRSSGRSSGQRFPFSPPGRSRWQEGVLLQGHPRPWPFAKLRTLWVPAHKVQARIPSVRALRFSLAISVSGARGSCHLRHSVPDKEAVHVCAAHVGGFLVFHSRAGSAQRQRPGCRQSRQPRLRRRSSKVSRLRRLASMTPAAPGEPAPRVEALYFYSCGSACSREPVSSASALVLRSLLWAVPAQAPEAVCPPHRLLSLSAAGSL